MFVKDDYSLSPDDIKAALAERGYNLVMVAKAMEKSPSLVSKVVASKARSYSVAEGVAKVLGRSVDEVFPGQYHPVNRKRYSATDEYEKKVEELRALLQSN